MILRNLLVFMGLMGGIGSSGVAQEAAIQLSLDQPYSSTLLPEQKHRFQLNLEGQKHLDIALQQKGVNIGVMVYDTKGQLILSKDQQRHIHGWEWLSFETQLPGTYHMELYAQTGYQLAIPLDRNAFIWDGERRVPYEEVLEGGDYVLRVHQQPKRDDAWGKIDQLFHPFQSGLSGGIAIGVVEKGKMIWSKGYGLANLEYQIPVSPHTAFHIASVSKQFAGYALASLHDQGKLSLDEPVQKYLPELQHLPSFSIRQMLNHTSGLRDQWIVAALAGWRMDDVITQQQLLKLIFRQKALNFTPGSQYHYSNSNYSLAAEIVQRVTGQSLRQWTSQHVFTPLNMRQTFFYDDHEEIVPQRSYSYDDRSGVVKKSVLSFANTGATSLFTTVHDFVKWMPNFTQPTVGNARIFEELTRPGVLNDGTVIRYALGVAVGEYKGLKTIDHSGVDAGYRSFMLVFPEKELGIIILSNQASANPGALARQIADIYLDLPADLVGNALTEQAPRQAYSPPVSLTDKEIKALEGVYYSPELQTQYTLFAREGKLYLGHKRFEDVLLMPRGKDQFKGTYWIFDELSITRDRNGNVQGFQVSNRGVFGLNFQKITHPLFTQP
jgi:CubicO group peptidase (beta-lactamase class C family)